MSHSLLLLRLLADGTTYTEAQMKEMLGLSDNEIRLAMSCLRKEGAMRAVAQPFQITPAGTVWLKAREIFAAEKKLAAERMDAKRAERAANPKGRGRPITKAEDHARRKQEKAKRIQARKDTEAALKPVQRLVAAELSRDAIVASAVASRPALQAFWGQSA